MGQRPEIVVRGRCACGKRYRVRHAQPGIAVSCPNCGRPIAIEEADLRAARANERLIPPQSDVTEPAEAVPIDDAELRPARRGSRAGATDQFVQMHEDGLLREAMMGGPRRAGLSVAAPLPPDSEESAGPGARRPRLFFADLLASFYFAGSSRSCLAFLATTLACAIPWMIAMAIAGFVPSLLSLAVRAVATLYVVLFVSHFLWQTLTLTARGEDEIPIVDPTWDWWEDALRPALWIVTITGICALPALAVWWLAPDIPARPLVITALAAAGSLFWPVAVMSAALGQSLVFIRPDWLVRCLFAVGAVYLIAWLLIMTVAGLLVAFFLAGDWLNRGPAVVGFLYPVGAAAVAFYLGFVLFRTLGLLFRHFRRRFPWRF